MADLEFYLLKSNRESERQKILSENKYFIILE
jgi:hypothetical protein